MGSSATSHVVYGYYFGGPEGGWQLEGVDEYGEYGGMPEGLPWLDKGDEDDEDYDYQGNIITQAEEHLTRVLGGLDPSEEVSWESPDRTAYDAWLQKKWAAKKKVPVEFVMGGGYDFADWSLAAWSDSGEWGNPVVLDLAVLEEQRITEDWDGKLASALAVLGVVPKQEKPAWFVFASYG